MPMDSFQRNSAATLAQLQRMGANPNSPEYLMAMQGANQNFAQQGGNVQQGGQPWQAPIKQNAFGDAGDKAASGPEAMGAGNANNPYTSGSMGGGSGPNMSLLGWGDQANQGRGSAPTGNGSSVAGMGGAMPNNGGGISATGPVGNNMPPGRQYGAPDPRMQQMQQFMRPSPNLGFGGGFNPMMGNMPQFGGMRPQMPQFQPQRPQFQMPQFGGMRQPQFQPPRGNGGFQPQFQMPQFQQRPQMPQLGGMGQPQFQMPQFGGGMQRSPYGGSPWQMDMSNVNF